MVDTMRDDTLDFDRFHREVLPARLAAGNGALAVDDARRIGPLAIRHPAGTFTYVPGTGTIEIVEGDDDREDRDRSRRRVVARARE